jgi:hypothetical protein
VCWSAVRVCWNVVIRVSLKFRVKIHQISSTQAQPQRSHQVFGIKVRVKVYQVCLSINTLRIGRSVLVQCCKVYQTQSCQQEGKQIMKAVKAVKGRVVNGKAAPLPTDNTCSNNWKSTRQTCNYSSSPERHLLTS